MVEKGQDNESTWSSIASNEGSVQQLDFLNDHEKAVFKTAPEINQAWLVDLCADRTPFITQSQSFNVFLPGDVHKKELHDVHFSAWKKGVKSMYYCRSTSIQRAEKVSTQAVENELLKKPVKKKEIGTSVSVDMPKTGASIEYDECLSCQ